MVEHRQVGGHVDGDAVHGAPAPRPDALGPHADGGDLAGPLPRRVDPHARELVVAGAAGQAEVGERVDDEALQPVHVRRARRDVVGHGDDRVRHELAGTVVGHVAAAVGALERRADRRGVDEDVPVVGVRAERVDVRVLQQEEVVVRGLAGQRVLQRGGLVVRDRPEGPDAQHRPAPQSSAAQSRVPRSSATFARNSET